MNDEQGRTLRNTRRLSFVPRWVVAPTIRRQNVAEHSFNVACICDILLTKHAYGDDPLMKLEVLRFALYHDADEAYTGDKPAPSKDGTRRAPEELTPAEVVLKVADLLDAYLFCMEETQMGNHTMSVVADDAFSRGEKYWEYFDWHENGGSKPCYGSVVGWFEQEAKLYRHPVLEAR